MAVRVVHVQGGGRAIVDRDAVRFLADAEAAGIRILNCPEYVRSWIAAERDWQQKRPQEPDNTEPPP